MNRDIKIMVELQRYWGYILKAQADIERSKKSIVFWQGELTEKNKEVSLLADEIKQLKIRSKQNETDLDEIDGTVSKLEERRLLVKSERELEALNHELEKAQSQQGELEESVILSMDELEEKEGIYSGLIPELAEKEKQVESDIIDLKDKIKGFEAAIAENMDKFESLANNLPSAIKTRFVKTLKAKGCKGVAEVNNSTCGNCNFQIPPDLVREAARNESATTCTNCGGYIYSEG
ncbi:MAG: hypothetical protein GY754_18195 [bacterium]|nr:hypothetical protein [bacterium]